MRKRNIIVAAFVSLAMVLGFMTPAFADTLPSCSGADMTTSSGSCADISSSSSSSKVTSSSYAAVTTKGKIALTSYGSMSLKAQRATTCKWVPKGWNALKDDVNHPHWIWWPWRTRICRSKSSPTGWVKVDSKDTTGWPKNCKNFFRTTKPATAIKTTQVLYVKSFANWKFTGHVNVQATAQASSTAKAWCSTAGSSASGSGTGSASSTAKTSASVVLTGLTQIKTWIKNKSASLTQSFKLQISLAIQALAKANASTNATANAQCSNTTPTPQQTPPTIVNMTTINDVDMGGTSPNFNVTPSLPGTDSGTLMCTALYGSFTPSSITVSGLNTYSFTYVAPSDSTATSALTEQVTCTVRDNTTGLTASKSESFPVNLPAVHP